MNVALTWNEFAQTVEMVNDLSEKGFAFQFLHNSINIYHNDDIVRFCDDIEEFADALITLMKNFGDVNKTDF